MIQGAAQILGSSRLLFYSHLLYCSSIFDPTVLGSVYRDTDSNYVIHTFKKLEEHVRPEMHGLFQRTKHLMYAEPESNHTQAGKMEIEAQYDGGGIFRSAKSYSLFNSDGSKSNKMKGVARHVRDQMDPIMHFGAKPDKTWLTSYWRMGPTPAHTIGMSVTCRRLVSSCNLKRHVFVRFFFSISIKGG